MKPVNWFVLGFILTVMEIIVPGFVIFWFGIAGVITGIIALFMPSLAVQIPIFVVLSGILVFSAQKIARRWTKDSPEKVGSERLHDARGIVIERINPPALGMVKVLGEAWRAEAAGPIEVGVNVRVKKVVGNHVVVAPETTTQK